MLVVRPIIKQTVEIKLGENDNFTHLKIHSQEFIKDPSGRKWKKIIYIEKHHTLWKVGMGLKAFLGTLFLALCQLNYVKKMWQKAIGGEAILVKKEVILKIKKNALNKQAQNNVTPSIKIENISQNTGNVIPKDKLEDHIQVGKDLISDQKKKDEPKQIPQIETSISLDPNKQEILLSTPKQEPDTQAIVKESPKIELEQSSEKRPVVKTSAKKKEDQQLEEMGNPIDKEKLPEASSESYIPPVDQPRQIDLQEEEDETLSKFDHNLKEFYELPIAQKKKRRNLLRQIFEDPALKDYLREDATVFFNHLDVNDYYIGPFDQIHSLYFEFANDEELKKFIDICIDNLNKDGAYCLVFNFNHALKRDQIQRLINLKITPFRVLSLIYDTNPLLFEIILGFYQKRPIENLLELKSDYRWTNLLEKKYSNISYRIIPYIIAAMFKHEFSKPYHQNLEQSILNILQIQKSPSEFAIRDFLNIFLPHCLEFEENKLRALMGAIYTYAIRIQNNNIDKTLYDSLRAIISTKNSILIASFLKEFLPRNILGAEPIKGLAAIFESITDKEQALGLIKAIMTLPEEQKRTYFCELHNRIRLWNQGHEPNYIFGYEEVFEGWEETLQESGLILANYPFTEGFNPLP